MFHPRASQKKEIAFVSKENDMGRRVGTSYSKLTIEGIRRRSVPRHLKVAQPWRRTFCFEMIVEIAHMFAELAAVVIGKIEEFRTCDTYIDL